METVDRALSNTWTVGIKSMFVDISNCLAICFRNLVLCVLVGLVFLTVHPHWRHTDCFLSPPKAPPGPMDLTGHTGNGHHFPIDRGRCQQ